MNTMCFHHNSLIFVGILMTLCFLEPKKVVLGRRVVPSKRVYKQLGLP